MNLALTLLTADGISLSFESAKGYLEAAIIPAFAVERKASIAPMDIIKKPLLPKIILALSASGCEVSRHGFAQGTN